MGENPACRVFILLATLLLLFVQRTQSLSASELMLGWPLLAPVLIVLALMFASRFGVVALAGDFWYAMGVPIRAGQLAAAILRGIVVLHGRAGVQISGSAG